MHSCVFFDFLGMLSHQRKKSTHKRYNEKNPTLQNNPKQIPPKKRRRNQREWVVRKVPARVRCLVKKHVMKIGVARALASPWEWAVVDSFLLASPQIRRILVEDSCIYKFWLSKKEMYIYYVDIFLTPFSCTAVESWRAWANMINEYMHILSKEV